MSNKPVILIIGSNGQLGATLKATLSEQAAYTCVAWDKSQCDLQNYAQINDQLNQLKPKTIINAAAYTQVDQAEKEKDKALAINGDAIRNLAACCAKQSIRLLHISTDYVFSGQTPHFQTINEATSPVNWYGASKLAGETALIETQGLDWLCLRTAWVYSNQGNNFLNTILKLMQANKPIRVVTDQIGTPTSTQSLTQALLACLEKPEASGLHHWTDTGVASWYDFAVQIQEEALRQEVILSGSEITPILSEEYPTLAKRPRVSLLCKKQTIEALKINPPHWRASLQNMIKLRKKDQVHQDPMIHTND